MNWLEKFIKKAACCIPTSTCAVGAMALLTGLCGCRDFIFEDPQEASDNSDEIWLSLTMDPYSAEKTRTSSNFWDKMDQEDGQDWENEIKSAIIILTNSDATNIITSFKVDKESNLTKNDEMTTALFPIKIEYAAKLFGNNEELKAQVFVICNPPADMGLPSGNDIQQIMSVISADDKTYGGLPDGDGAIHPFLMTNGDYDSKDDATSGKYSVTIKLNELKEHTQKSNPYKIGYVPVQRALARFDIDNSNAEDIYYFDENGELISSAKGTETPPSGWKTSVTLEYLGLANVSSNFNLFKEAGSPEQNGGKGTWSYFWSEVFETENVLQYRYVYDPKYLVSGGKRDLPSNYSVKTANNLFQNNVFDPSFLRGKDNYDKEGSDGRAFSIFNNIGIDESKDKGDTHKIWKYCIPNTIHEAEMQKNGISTCLVFVGKMEFVGLGEGTNANASDGQEYQNTPVYVWGGKPYGTNRALWEMAKHPQQKKDYAMAMAYKNAVEEARDKAKWVNRESKKEYVELEFDKSISIEGKNQENYDGYNALPTKEFAEALIKNGFSIYEPFDPQGNGSLEYMCYYYYWVRHNDNNIDDVMGPMEFGVVRNNIYRVRVGGLNLIGHPLPDPDIPTDSDPITPNTDDETFNRYFSIKIGVLPWLQHNTTQTW